MMKTKVKVIIQKKSRHSKMMKKISKALSVCTSEYPVMFKVNVFITDDEGIREYNRQYRNIDKATDVLSFPMLDNQDGELSYEPYDFDGKYLFLGDIVVSHEKMESQAKEYQHSLEREAAFLLMHGMLHLLGYDHEDDKRETLMKNKQEEYLLMKGYRR